LTFTLHRFIPLVTSADGAIKSKFKLYRREGGNTNGCSTHKLIATLGEKTLSKWISF